MFDQSGRTWRVKVYVEGASVRKVGAFKSTSGGRAGEGKRKLEGKGKTGQNVGKVVSVFGNFG
jgi:hypothetical protein